MTKFIARLRLLDYGLVQEASEIAEEQLLRTSNFVAAESDSQPRKRASSAGPGSSEAGDGVAEAEDGDGELVLKKDQGQKTETIAEFKRRIDGQVGVMIYQAIQKGHQGRGRDREGVVYEARKTLISEFMKAVIRRRCEVCEA